MTSPSEKPEPPPIPEHLARRMREWLRDNAKGKYGPGTKIAELAGCSRSMISQVANGRKKVTYSVADGLARYWGTTLEALLQEPAQGENAPGPEPGTTLPLAQHPDWRPAFEEAVRLYSGKIPRPYLYAAGEAVVPGGEPTPNLIQQIALNLLERDRRRPR